VCVFGGALACVTSCEFFFAERREE